MTLLTQIQRGRISKPPRVLLYGVEGIGKSTFGSQAPKPIFIQTEDGLDEIDCDKFPLATSYDDVLAALLELRTQPHEFESVVIDSLDWLERLVWDKLCAQANVNSIEKVDGGYSKGYTHALTYWREIIDYLNALRKAPAKECPECQAVIAAGFGRCPQCGYEFPPPERQKHEAKASEAGVLSGQVTTTKHVVKDVHYSIHVKRGAAEDAPRTLRVDYRVGWHQTKSEWVCFEHEGFARRKAETWWRRRSPDPVPSTVEEAQAIADGGGLAETRGSVAVAVFRGTLLATGAVINWLAPLIAALASPTGLVIAAVVALGAALLYVSGIGSKVFTFLGNAFKTLAADASLAWQGIADALVAGDLGLAAKIAWLTIKLEWQRGIAWISEKWSDFKAFFVESWAAATFTFARLFVRMAAGIQSIWSNVTSALTKGWEHFTSGAVSLWDNLQNELSQGIVDLWALVDDSVDAAGTKQTLQRDHERQQQKNESAKQERLNQIETERESQQHQIDADESVTLATLEEDRQRAKSQRQQARDADLKATADELAAAKDEWRGALDEAAKKRAAVEAGLGLPKLDQIDTDDLETNLGQVQKKQETQGTFNPAALRYFDNRGWQDRTAKATEETAKNTKRLIQVTLDNKLVFA